MRFSFGEAITVRRFSSWRALPLMAACSLLSGCAGGIIPEGHGPATTPAPTHKPTPAKPRPPVSPSQPTPAAPAETALTAGIAAGPSVSQVVPQDAHTVAALGAFRLSCPALMWRTDQSGLTQGTDWAQACAAAASWPDATAADFFARYFETAQVGTGATYVTGYYEPEIAGSRIQTGIYQTPIYKRPPDLINVDLAQFRDALKGKKIRGRVEGRNFIPYFARADIVDSNALAAKGLELAWAADPIELFFLQIQGSGRLRLPDGSVMRIGYDDQNGRDYTGIGKLMKDRGLIQAGSMQDIMAYLRANPEEGRKIMNENKSFVFFRELNGAGPIGAMGVAVTGEASVAADPAFVPLGAPVMLSLDRGEANGLWVAQDTGGAIKGANRFDTFWGAGERARSIAGGMSARGTTLLLLPIGTVARINALPK